MHTLTPSQHNCVRYAITDGECSLYGCRNCPGAGELHAKILAEQPRKSDSWFYVLIAIVVLAGIFGGAKAMARVEHAEQMARV
jgi:hypothetical protein